MSGLVSDRGERWSHADCDAQNALFLNKPGTTSHNLSCLFSYVSAKLRNALPDFIRTYEFTGFKRESRAAFCTAAFLFNEYIFKYYVFSRYLYMLCILAVNVMSRRH